MDTWKSHATFLDLASDVSHSGALEVRSYMNAKVWVGGIPV